MRKRGGHIQRVAVFPPHGPKRCIVTRWRANKILMDHLMRLPSSLFYYVWLAAVQQQKVNASSFS